MISLVIFMSTICIVLVMFVMALNLSMRLIHARNIVNVIPYKY